MPWIGLLLGVVFGGAFGGVGGAIMLGLLGCLAGFFVMNAQARPAAGLSPASTEESPPVNEDQPGSRMEQLEREVWELRVRVARLEQRAPTGGPAEAPAPLRPKVEPEPAVEEAIPVPVPQPAMAVSMPIDEAPAEPVAATQTAAPPPEPSKPREPERGLVDRLLEGNIVAKLGVVILFFGVAFLLKFAYDRGFFPPGMRLAGVAAASAAMFFIGARLLAGHRTYALVLMGGAMGLLYLDVFFALKTFQLIGPAFGFTLFALLGVATLLGAVRLDARAFAALGLLGGFLAPVLASTGGGHHVLLFSYYLLLNLVIVATSWFRSWRELNFIGFLFTFAISLLWGYSSYRPELFATVEPFLVAFFALYLAIPILFAFRQPPRLKGFVDGTLVFGMPLSASMMQAALTRGLGDHLLAWSAFLATLVYAVLARVLWRRENMRLLAEAHLALAIVFGTVAPYYAFEGYPTFAFWSVEAAAIFWLGCRQRRVLARAFALALMIGAAGYFWWVTRDSSPGHAVWNERVIGCALIAASSLVTAWFMRRFAAALTDFERALEGWVVAWSGAWMLAAAHLAVDLAWGAALDRLTAMLLLVAGGLAAMEYAGRRLDWARLRLATVAGAPLMLVYALLWLVAGSESHPLKGGGVFAWPIALAVHFHLVHRQLRDGLATARALRYSAAWILMLLLATWEALWRLDHDQNSWVLAIGAAGLLAAGLRFRLREHGVEGAAKRSGWVIAWALAWWFTGLLGLADDHLARDQRLGADLLVFAVSALAFELAGRRLAWTALRRSQVLLPAAMLAAAMWIADQHGHPFEHWQALAWLVSFAAAYLVLARQERDALSWAPAAQHLFLFAAILALLAWEAHWQAHRAGLPEAWSLGAVGATFALGLGAAIAGLGRGLWPFKAHGDAFRSGAVIPLLFLALLWTAVANLGNDGTASPWRYIPVLNPLDLAQLALFAAAIAALRPGGPVTDPAASWMRVFAAAGFFWLNAALLRTVHHWAGVPFELHALLRSVVAQAALSLLWTATALVMMFAAGRRRSRPLWMAGAALLAVVVAKLFLNDLGNTGTVARIVSFIGVGVFMLLIGFLSPVPPRRQEAAG